MHKCAVRGTSIDDGASDVHHSFCDEPAHSNGLYTVEEWLEGHKHRESHKDVAGRFEVAVLFEMDKTDDSSRNGCKPDEAEQPPPPQTTVAHGDERDGGIAACDVPIDGSVVEPAPHFARGPSLGNGVIYGGRDVAGQHPRQIKYDSGLCPLVVCAEAPHEKHHTDNNSHEYSCGMAP